MSGKNEVVVDKIGMILHLGGVWGEDTGKAKPKVVRGSTFYPYLIRLSVRRERYAIAYYSQCSTIQHEA